MQRVACRRRVVRLLRWPDFKALLPGQRPLRTRWRLDLRVARCSPGLRSPPGSVPTRPRTTKVLLPRAFARSARGRDRSRRVHEASPAPRSLYGQEVSRPRTELALPIRERYNPHGVRLPHRRPQRFTGRPVLAHGFTSGAPRRHRLRRVPLRTVAGTLEPEGPCGRSPLPELLRSSCR